MVAQLGWAPLASTPTPAFSTDGAAVSSHRLAHCNMRSGGLTRLSSAGARFPTPSSAGRQGPLAMALGAAFLLAAVRKDLADTLVKYDIPRPENLARHRQLHYHRRPLALPSIPKMA